MIAGLVPAKALRDGKSRLRKGLGDEAAEQLAMAMLCDVVAALQGCETIERVAVVTPDKGIAERVEALGAEALVGDDPGLNPSLERGARLLAREAGDALLVVLGDVAGIRAADAEEVLRRLDEMGPRGVVLVPSADGGTAALARRPADVIPPRFGAQSAAAHREEAKSRGVPLIELAIEALSIDVDSETDLREAQRRTGTGPHTRAALVALGLGEDPP